MVFVAWHAHLVTFHLLIGAYSLLFCHLSLALVVLLCFYAYQLLLFACHLSLATYYLSQAPCTLLATCISLCGVFSLLCLIKKQGMQVCKRICINDDNTFCPQCLSLTWKAWSDLFLFMPHDGNMDLKLKPAVTSSENAIWYTGYLLLAICYEWHVPGVLALCSFPRAGC